jgi:hypothetical protein
MVTYPVVPGPVLAAGMMGLAFSGPLILIATFVVAGVPSVFLAAAVLVGCAVVAAGCWRFWKRQQRPRVLRWDGERWWLTAAGQDVAMDRVQVRLDWQRWMLLWCRPAGSRRGGEWLWIQAATDPQRWQLLRCALYSPVTLAGAQIAPEANV